MPGSREKRFCQFCHKKVHDFTQMQPRQIERLVAETGGNVCARISRRPDSSLLTLDPAVSSPYGAAMLLSVTLALAPAALSQTSSRPTSAPSLTGTVRDPQGALVVNSTVTLLQAGAPVTSTQTSSDGQFAISAPHGDYIVRVEAAGFALFTAPITVRSEETALAEITIKPGTETQVTITAQLLDSTNVGALSVSYGPWYKRLAFHLRHPIAYAKYLLQ